MTTITVPRETWDALREALEEIICAHPATSTMRQVHAIVAGRNALTAANAESGLTNRYTVQPQAPLGHDGNGCNEVLRMAGKVYPRTCKACGLGPCKWKSAANAESVEPLSKQLEGKDYPEDWLEFADKMQAAKAVQPQAHGEARLTLQQALNESGLCDYYKEGDLAFSIAAHKFAALVITHPQATEPQAVTSGITLAQLVQAHCERNLSHEVDAKMAEQIAELLVSDPATEQFLRRLLAGSGTTDTAAPEQKP